MRRLRGAVKKSKTITVQRKKLNARDCSLSRLQQAHVSAVSLPLRSQVASAYFTSRLGRSWQFA